VTGIEERMMDCLMRDPGLRTQLLRFIDVFPVLASSSQVRDHLGAYLSDASPPPRGAPWIVHLMRLGGNVAGSQWTPAGISAALSRWMVTHMARRFIVESDAVKSLHGLEERGCLFTLDVLGEAVHSEAEAERFSAKYRDLAATLSERMGSASSVTPLSGPRVNLSVKLSALTAHFDPGAPDRTACEVADRLRSILRAAREAGTFINVDMEHFEVRDLTWRIFRETLSEPEFADWEDVGLVVQAYLCDAESHLAEILEWLRTRPARITVRLVKGAYWDSEQIWARQRSWPIPVLLNKAETDAQCERMAQTLLENPSLVRTALGSHNARTVAKTLALAEALSTNPGDLEIQVLHGMGETLGRALVAMGHPVRVYVPWGQLIPGMAYMVRRLLENTSNESFLRQMGSARGEMSALLSNPAEHLEGEVAA
jgi:RHH-type proline utilization regulon transcriptional repressor/proline dehydrogenase/delta 1-pyrroline-5-carboxylate dehydrogenase